MGSLDVIGVTLAPVAIVNFAFLCGSSLLNPLKAQRFSQKNSRRLELSISKNTPHGRSRAVSTQGFRQVCLFRCPKSQNLKHFAIREKFSSIFSAIFPQLSSGAPERPRKQPQPSRVFLTFTVISREINHCSRCAHDPNYSDSPPPPHKNPPLATPITVTHKRLPNRTSIIFEFVSVSLAL